MTAIFVNAILYLTVATVLSDNTQVEKIVLEQFVRSTFITPFLPFRFINPNKPILDELVTQTGHHFIYMLLG